MRGRRGLFLTTSEIDYPFTEKHMCLSLYNISKYTILLDTICASTSRQFRLLNRVLLVLYMYTDAMTTEHNNLIFRHIKEGRCTCPRYCVYSTSRNAIIITVIDGLVAGQRRRQSFNIKPSLGQCVLLATIPPLNTSKQNPVKYLKCYQLAQI